MKTCRFCGKQSRNYMDEDRHGWYCRNELACFNRVYAKLRGARTDLSNLKAVGEDMARVLQHYAQQPGTILTDTCAASMKYVAERWNVARSRAR